MTEELSVSLGSGISYVYGVVNGEVADFTLTGEGVWSATVPKAEDGKYSISITAYDGGGNATEYNVVLYYLDDMMPTKTDWTQFDFYNAQDFNRVNANAQFLVQQLESDGYSVSLSYALPEVSRTSFPTVSLVNRLRANILDITDGFYYPPDAPVITVNPSRKQTFDYNDANALELLQRRIYELILSLRASYRLCGTFYSGEEGLL